METKGRRILMLIGLGGMTVLFAVITIALKYAVIIYNAINFALQLSRT